MTSLVRIRLTTLGWLLIAPVTFLGLIPWWLHRAVEGEGVHQASPWHWLGVWLLLNGIGLAAWCVQLFNVEGAGTPLPFDPPTRFVTKGPYQYVRNPMALGFFLILAGEAAFLQSITIFLYLLVTMPLMHAMVRFIEEPALTRRFGTSFAAYRQHVPRWMPRLRPTHQPRSNT